MHSSIEIRTDGEDEGKRSQAVVRHSVVDGGAGEIEVAP